MESIKAEHLCMCSKHIGRSQRRPSHMWSHDNVKLNIMNHVLLVRCHGDVEFFFSEMLVCRLDFVSEYVSVF